MYGSGIVISIMSSLYNIPLNRHEIVIGEVGLTERSVLFHIYQKLKSVKTLVLMSVFYRKVSLFS